MPVLFRLDMAAQWPTLDAAITKLNPSLTSAARGYLIRQLVKNGGRVPTRAKRRSFEVASADSIRTAAKPNAARRLALEAAHVFYSVTKLPPGRTVKESRACCGEFMEFLTSVFAARGLERKSLKTLRGKKHDGISVENSAKWACKALKRELEGLAADAIEARRRVAAK
jgi:hypothetical protein